MTFSVRGERHTGGLVDLPHQIGVERAGRGDGARALRRSAAPSAGTASTLSTTSDEDRERHEQQRRCRRSPRRRCRCSTATSQWRPCWISDRERVHIISSWKSSGTRLDRVDDRRAPEQQLQRDLPDRLHVAVAHVQHRQQHRQRRSRARRPPSHAREERRTSSSARGRRRRSIANTNTTRMPSARFAAAVIDTEIGTAARGKDTLRSRFSRATRLPSPPLVASEKKLNTTIAASSTTG